MQLFTFLDIRRLYGIRGNAFLWLQFYVTNRIQEIVLHLNSLKVNSDERIDHLVTPKGSMLGSIIFVYDK